MRLVVFVGIQESQRDFSHIFVFSTNRYRASHCNLPTKIINHDEFVVYSLNVQVAKSHNIAVVMSLRPGHTKGSPWAWWRK